MTFTLRFTPEAARQLRELESNPASAQRLKLVRKTLGLMETNLRHPSLNTHEFTSLSQQLGIKVFEAYVQNKTPGAYRIFFHYGPGKGVLTIVAITAHP